MPAPIGFPWDAGTLSGRKLNINRAREHGQGGTRQKGTRQKELDREKLDRRELDRETRERD